MTGGPYGVVLDDDTYHITSNATGFPQVVATVRPPRYGTEPVSSKAATLTELLNLGYAAQQAGWKP